MVSNQNPQLTEQPRGARMGGSGIAGAYPKGEYIDAARSFVRFFLGGLIITRQTLGFMLYACVAIYTKTIYSPPLVQKSECVTYTHADQMKY